jgi:hypothetical protein
MGRFFNAVKAGLAGSSASVSSRPSNSPVFALLIVAAQCSLVAAGAWQAKPGPMPAKDMSELRARTPQERALAAYFDRFGGDRPIGSAGTVLTSEESGPPAYRPAYAALLHQRVCASDAVAIGRIAESRILLNTKETYLFTMYSVEIDRAVRPIYLPSPLLVGSPGGHVVLADGHDLQAGAAPPFAIGERRVLFLKRVDARATYTRVGSAMRLVNDSVDTDSLSEHDLIRSLLPVGLIADAFTSDLEDASRACYSPARS